MNEFSIIKIKKPSEDDLSDYIKDRRDMYIKRVEDRLTCIICIFYRVPECGDL